jgi:hypothetical protein
MQLVRPNTWKAIISTLVTKAENSILREILLTDALILLGNQVAYKTCLVRPYAIDTCRCHLQQVLRWCRFRIVLSQLKTKQPPRTHLYLMPHIFVQGILWIDTPMQWRDLPRDAPSDWATPYGGTASFAVVLCVTLQFEHASSSLPNLHNRHFCRSQTVLKFAKFAISSNVA